jgi:hypothetical protein
MGYHRTHPGALIGLAHVLQAGYPKMTAQQAVDNAQAIIRGLHKMELEIGPIDAFGPHDTTKVGPLDALDVAADMIEQEMDRKPWLP